MTVVTFVERKGILLEGVVTKKKSKNIQNKINIFYNFPKIMKVLMKSNGTMVAMTIVVMTG